ncbi:hypothetical protein WCE41_01900 [Luteimonas sp. MJ246]|uniref:hypothetical protein n=1 Tax=Luteimonas sp. MJ174 TaxID=3129237 RepID=UPI0031B9E244
MGKQTRDELDRRIAELRALLPELLALEDKDQMDAFAGIAEEIVEDAENADCEYVQQELERLLSDAGPVDWNVEPAGK